MMIIIRELKETEINKAHNLVESVFDRFIAPGFSNEGIDEFKDYITPERLADRLNAGNHFRVAEIAGELVGLIEVRNEQHVALLFVKADHQRKGVARLLLNEVVKICLQANPDLKRVTVNSSPNARHAYRRMGFAPASEEQEFNGIRFTPMSLDLVKSGHR